METVTPTVVGRRVVRPVGVDLGLPFVPAGPPATKSPTAVLPPQRTSAHDPRQGGRYRRPKVPEVRKLTSGTRIRFRVRLPVSEEQGIEDAGSRYRGRPVRLEGSEQKAATLLAALLRRGADVAAIAALQRHLLQKNRIFRGVALVGFFFKLTVPDVIISMVAVVLWATGQTAEDSS